MFKLPHQKSRKLEYLWRQELSFRGHRDDSKYHPEPEEFAKKSVGNFVEFLQFRVRGGNIYFKNNLENSTKNATYVSKEFLYLKMILLNM